jgi:hypothetical protein
MGKLSKNFFWCFLLLGSKVFSLDVKAKEINNKLPLGTEIYLTNNVGAGTVSKAYEQDPYAASWLYVYPYYKSEPFWHGREFKLQTEVLTIMEWRGKDNPWAGKLSNKLTLGDFKIRAELQKALHVTDWGLSISPALKVELPLSKASRDMNRIAGLGGYVNAKWSSQGFFLAYKPVVLAYLYSEPFKTGACGEGALLSDQLGDGDCKASGRQTRTLVKNTVFLGYALRSHSWKLGLRTYHSFLREPGSGEKPEIKPTSGVMESTLGILEYAYNFDTDMPTTIILGVSSLQNPYDRREGFRWPFFDFTEPAKNLTEAYVALNVTI